MKLSLLVFLIFLPVLVVTVGVDYFGVDWYWGGDKWGRNGARNGGSEWEVLGVEFVWDGAGGLVFMYICVAMLSWLLSFSSMYGNGVNDFISKQFIKMLSHRWRVLICDSGKIEIVEDHNQIWNSMHSTIIKIWLSITFHETRVQLAASLRCVHDWVYGC